MNINNVTNMITYCSRLKSLPSISKLNINKLEDMSFMFYGCTSLESISDLNEWKLNDKNYNFIFYYCPSIKPFPNKFKWIDDSVDTLEQNLITSIF